MRREGREESARKKEDLIVLMLKTQIPGILRHLEYLILGSNPIPGKEGKDSKEIPG